MGEEKISRIPEDAIDLSDPEGKIKLQEKKGHEAGISGASEELIRTEIQENRDENCKK